MSPESDLKTSKPQPSLSRLLIQLWLDLPKRRHRQLLLLLVLMLVSAFAEMISLGAVLPFIGVLTSPDRVFNQPSIRRIAETVGIASAGDLVLPLTVGFAAAALIAGAIRILLLWANTKLAFAIGAELSIEVYRRTLYQPYRIHLARNSSELISSVTTKTGMAAYSVLCLLNVLSSIFLLFALIIALMAIDPIVVLSAFVGLAASYAIITLISRYWLIGNSQMVASQSTKMIKALQEGLGGIRDVLLNETQPVYCNVYREADLKLRRAQGSNIFIGGSPRLAMEAIGMCMIAAVAYWTYIQQGNFNAALPMLGALALGAQRVLPALQQVYSNWVTIVGCQASLFEVIDLLNQPLTSDALEPKPSPLQFANAIRLESVRFRYTPSGPWVLDGLTLSIPKGARVGFVGPTGSGKSTTLDLLMGLLEPTAGHIMVDGQQINGLRLRAWRQTIAHVPQSVFLADITIAENIALGIPRKAIDMDRVRQAAHQAQIDKFIESRRKAYNELVGERGIRLSGGQRQRIGIARALYKQASVLVFDEATSSLDNATEQAVMESIESLNKDLTILIIAHRLTTVQRCDEIIELEHGRVVAQGSYKQLLEWSPSFKRMALAVE